MRLDLAGHCLEIAASWGERRELPLIGQAASDFKQTCLSTLASWEIHPEIDDSLFADPSPRAYDRKAVEDFWQALSRLEAVLQDFKKELPGQTSPVQLWPHNFDLALMWLSGRKIPGFDPDDEEHADEQISFGFSTGDTGIPDAYLYAAVYPWLESLPDRPLPAGAVWHTQGWKGALLMYAPLADTQDPQERLLEFLRAVFQAGSAFMR
jgi:hypothetical protein